MSRCQNDHTCVRSVLSGSQDARVTTPFPSVFQGRERETTATSGSQDVRMTTPVRSVSARAESDHKRVRSLISRWSWRERDHTRPHASVRVTTLASVVSCPIVTA